MNTIVDEYTRPDLFPNSARERRLTPGKAVRMALPFAAAFVLTIAAAVCGHEGMDAAAGVLRIAAMYATLYGLFR